MITVKLAKPEENQLPNQAFSRAYNVWCKETFGLSFQGMPRKDCKWSDMRWCQYDTYLLFKNEEDAVLFLLKWK